MTRESEFLKDRLRAFKRRLYLYQALRGAIESGVITLIWGLLVMAVAYYYPMASMWRTILFYGSVLVLASIWAWRMLWPLWQAITLQQVLSDEAAAVIIGLHFPEIKDRLLNILQLEQMANAPETAHARQWIEAAIAQKTQLLRPIPFQMAVRFRKLRRYWRYWVPALIVWALVVWLAPYVISEGSERIIHYAKPMNAFAPFQFVVLGSPLRVPRGTSLELQVQIRGRKLPDRVSIELEGRNYWMHRRSDSVFFFMIHHLVKSLRFRMHADGFYSEWYPIEVVPSPALERIEITAQYPDYLEIPPQRFREAGQLEVPVGTQLEWHLHARDAETVLFQWADSTHVAHRTGQSAFRYHRKILNGGTYRVIVQHPSAIKVDSHDYVVVVVPDAPPTIDARFIMDTIAYQYVTIEGEIADDHGFSRLVWAIGKSAGPNSKIRWQYWQMPLPKGVLHYRFLDWRPLDSLWQGAEELRMYIEVWDNDAVTGPKSARTPLWTLRKPSPDKLREEEARHQQMAQHHMNTAYTASRSTRRRLEERLMQMIQQYELRWQDRQMIQRLLEDIRRQKTEWENALEELKRAEARQQQTQQVDSQTLQQIRQLQHRMKEIFDEEFQKQLAELEQMIDNGWKRNLEQKLNELLQRQQAIEKAMERDMAMYRRWRLERSMEWQALKLEELAEKQQKLAQHTRNNQMPADSLARRQDSLNQALDSIAAAHQRLQQQARELNEQIPDLEQQFRQTRSMMQNAADRLRDGQQSKAASPQQDAAQQLQQMAEKMMASLQQRRQNVLMVSRRKLRQILDNLLEISTRQETLEQQGRTTPPRSRRFLKLMEQQRQLNEVTVEIRDSLQALAKDVPLIRQYIFKELRSIRHYQNMTVRAMTERQIGQMLQGQRRVMMHTNKLALMLSEILDNITVQLSSMMSGSQQCHSPSPLPSPSLQQMQQMQQGIQQQLQQSMQGQKGQQQGRQQKGRQQMTQQMAQILMQQEILRYHIRRLRQEQNKEAKKRLGQLLQEIEKMMEQVEQDIVHQRITPATVEQMERIQVRMLDAERAQRQQDESPERQSRTAKAIPPPVPPALEKYLREKQRHVEILRRIPPQFQPFYRNRARQYLQRIP